MGDGERRKLVFTNLLNGVPMAAIKEAFHLSEAEVMADFHFAIAKVRSYRFERALPVIDCDTLSKAQANREMLLHNITRLNLGVQPVYSRVGTLPLEQSGGMSQAEQMMLEMRMRGGAA